jgi:hypothetical protein
MMPPWATRFDASWLGFGIVLGSLAGGNGMPERATSEIRVSRRLAPTIERIWRNRHCLSLPPTFPIAGDR